MKIFGLDITRTKTFAAVPANPAIDLISTMRQQLLSGIDSNAGAAVNDDSVLSLSTAFACMKVIAEDVATTPLITYRRGKNNARDRATDLGIYYRLHDEPNPEMTAFTFKEMMTYQMLLPSGGFACAEIERNEFGKVKYLWPLLSKDVEIRRDPDTLTLFFRVHTPTGQTVDLPSYNVLHIPGMTINGYNGLSSAKVGANVIGLSLALEKFASLHFATGGFVKDYIKSPTGLSPEARTNLHDSWASGHSTLSMAQRTAILEEGMEYVSVMAELGKIMPPEVRAQQVLEVCRMYRMQPNKVQEYGRATWANGEQMQTNHYTDCLLPWFTRYEQECQRKLLMIGDRDVFFEFLADNYLRGDYKTRMEGYGIGIEKGIMKRNEARAKENLPPVEGGDEIFVPLNTAPLSKVMSGEIAPKEQAPGDVKK